MSDPYRFSIHYTREEARKLLPQITEWLQQLHHLDERLRKTVGTIERLVSTGQDRGGSTVEEYLTLQADFLEVLGEMTRRQILLKDLARGLVDFPAIIGGREVFLCWEQGEDDIEFWHDMDAGYAGRERL